MPEPARCTDVVEQWELSGDGAAALTSVLTVRARCVPSRDGLTTLPDAWRTDTRLAWTDGPAGAQLDARAHPHEGRVLARVHPDGVAHVVGRGVVTVPVQRFRAVFPTVSHTGATRRLASVPHAWLAVAPAEWTCVDDGKSAQSCATSTATAPPLGLVVPPVPPAPFTLVALGVLALALGAVAWRVHSNAVLAVRLAGAIASLVVAAALAFTLAGAHLVSFAGALLVVSPSCIALGALAAPVPGARIAGALALVALPLVAVLDGRPALVGALFAGAAAMVLGAVGRSRSAG